MFDETVLRSEEKAIFKLRSLYRKYGYLPYKMCKFEEYELYIRNKDFLVSDRIISFNDTNGKLMALKPDVTLSIIKNGDDVSGTKQKVFYNENVYRVSSGTQRFKEIMQTGLECIGDIDMYDVYEVVTLAAQSLMQISDEFVLEISHLGILSKLINDACERKSFEKNAIKYIAEKNAHDLCKLCDEYDVEEHKKDRLVSLISTYGQRNKVIEMLKNIVDDECIGEIETLSKMMDNLPYSSKIIFDFSLVNDTNYYNGFVLKGFVNGVCDSILAGGQYDNMMKKMGRKSKAIGFAIYIDRLEQMTNDHSQYDVDAIIVYDDKTSFDEVARCVEEAVKNGKTVTAQKNIPDGLRYKEIIKIGKGENWC